MDRVGNCRGGAPAAGFEQFRGHLMNSWMAVCSRREMQSLRWPLQEGMIALGCREGRRTTRGDKLPH